MLILILRLPKFHLAILSLSLRVNIRHLCDQSAAMHKYNSNQATTHSTRPTSEGKSKVERSTTLAELLSAEINIAGKKFTMINPPPNSLIGGKSSKEANITIGKATNAKMWQATRIRKEILSCIACKNPLVMSHKKPNMSCAFSFRFAIGDRLNIVSKIERYF